MVGPYGGGTLLLLAAGLAAGQVYYQPEQVHISYGAQPSHMVITWVTLSAVNSSLVEYGINEPFEYKKNGSETLFVDGGSEKRKIYMHRVTLTGLEPAQKYHYHCGNKYAWSTVFFFTTMPPGQNWSPRFLVYGDMGNENGRSIPALQIEAQQGRAHAILHVGDFAYDMNTDNARVGDAFMNQIEPIAGYLPYMVCPGNHEAPYNFSNYKSRFSMPGGDGQNMFYSWNIGPVHMISFNTEVYFSYLDYRVIQRQYKWLEHDLWEANQPETRKMRPWIITMGHKPMYCSNKDDAILCLNISNPVRRGSAFLPGENLEDLFYNYGVDLQFYAHEHSYERLFPIYNFTVCNGSTEFPYTNPKAPVHIITGSAGCKEGEDPFINPEIPYSAFQSDDYGYTAMTVYNNTHLYLEQYSVDKGEVIDKMWLIKKQHASGSYICNAKW